MAGLGEDDEDNATDGSAIAKQPDLAAVPVNIYLNLTVNRTRVSYFYKPLRAPPTKGNYVRRPGGRALSRKSHPYFGQLNRLESAHIVPRGKGRGRAPLRTPDEEPGVLWEAVREDSEGG